MFICFEGFDDDDKNIQSTNLFNFLKSENKQPVLLNFPDRETITGKLLNKEKTSNPRVYHLLFTANIWEKADQKTDLLKRGKYVICNNYYFYSIAATLSLDKYIPIEWLNNVVNGLPQPDVVIYSHKKENEIYNKLFSQEALINCFHPSSAHSSILHHAFTLLPLTPAYYTMLLPFFRLLRPATPSKNF